ncbi:MAG: two-component sensor histidine kinase [Deltaproteobacteria bacterium]|nr:MAG: two-component sensor histidine kinase [Deltaproteobacteria bacterium]
MFLKPLRELRKTTAFRLTLWYSSIFILSSLILFVLVYFLLSSVIQEKDRKIIEAKVEEYSLQYENAGRDAMLKEIRMEELSNERSGFLVRVADENNKTILLTLPRKWGGIRRDELEKGIPKSSENYWIHVHGNFDEHDHTENTYDDVLEVATHRLSDGYILQIGKDPEEREDFLERFQTIFAGILIPVIILGLAGGSFLALRALRPIKDLNRTVQNIIKTGKMDSRVPPSLTGDELDELTQLFNGMLEKIETLITGMKEALDNVAHDLRTPLTRLRGVVEMALQSDADEHALREALMDCAEESERMITILNTLMDISEAETGVMKLNRTQTNISVSIREVAELYEYVAEDKGITISVDVPERLAGYVDPNRITQVIANLLDNAIKYTEKGGKVEISARQVEDKIVISIKDTGCGIAPHDLPRIFERLYRGDKSRSHRGLGLGLSLVKAVIHAHGGDIDVKSKIGQGTDIRVSLPLNGNPAMQTWPQTKHRPKS